MKHLGLFIFIGLLSFGLKAQESPELEKGLTFDKSAHQLGLHAGLTTGIGFSYRYCQKNGEFKLQVFQSLVKTLLILVLV